MTSGLGLLTNVEDGQKNAQKVMKHLIRWSLLVLILGLVGACSKKKTAAEAPAGVEATATAATDETPSAAAVVAAAPEVATKRDWDAVVKEVAQLKMQRSLTDEKRAHMFQLQDELTAAATSDPRARQAYQNLSQILNGR